LQEYHCIYCQYFISLIFLQSRCNANCRIDCLKFQSFYRSIGEKTTRLSKDLPEMSPYFRMPFFCMSTHTHCSNKYHIYRVAQQIWHNFVRLITSSSVDLFSNFFRCQNQEDICNNFITTNPITHQVCRYTTLWNVSVLKATIENKKTPVTSHFKNASSSSN